MADEESLPDLVARLRLDLSEMQDSIGQASGIGSAIGTAIGGLASKGIDLAFGALSSLTTGAIAAAQESLKVGQATEQIVKSTGGAAGLSADQVGDLAGELSNLTGFDDELVQSGQNLLLTFKNVKEAGTGTDAIFSRASAAALDLSAAGFGSVESASLQLGKALNDPIKGIAALGRSGVTFTEQQKEQIKALTKTGDLLGAQKIILAEVEAQVGGVAQATADPFARFEVAIGNVQEALGAVLLPIASDLATAFVDDVVPGIEAGIGVLQKLGDGAQEFLAPVIDGVRGLVQIVTSGDFNGDLLGKLGLSEDSAVVDFLFDVRDAITGVYGVLANGDVTGALSNLGIEEDSAVVDFLFSVRDGVLQVREAFAAGDAGGVLAALGLDEESQATVLAAVDSIRGSLESAFSTIGTLSGPLGEAGEALTGTLLPALAEFGGGLATALLPVLASLYGLFYEQLLPVLTTVAGIVLGTVVPAVAGFVEKLAGALLPIIKTVAGFITGSVVPALGYIADGLQKGLTAAAPFIEFVVRLLGVLVQLAGAILGPVVQALAVVLGPALKVAGALIGALVQVVGEIIGAVGRFGNALLDAAEQPGKFGKAVQTAFSSALAFLRGIPGQIKAGFGALGTLLLSAGGDVVDGLINGIRNAIGRATKAARDLAGGVARAAREALGIASPSKVFAEIGAFTGQGLIEGMTGKASEVEATGKKVAESLEKGFTERLGKADLGYTAAQKVLRDLTGVQSELLRVAREREELADTLKIATDDLQFAIKFQEDFIASVAAQGEKLGDLIGFDLQALSDANGGGAAGIAAGLRGAKFQVEEYGRALEQLRADGLSDELYRRLAEAGPAAGAGVVASLRAAGEGGVREISNLSQELAAASGKLGSTVGSNLFDAGIRAAEGLIEGLKAKDSELQRYATELANRLGQSIRSALKIKSPSRVTAELGEQVGAGLALGILRSSSEAADAAAAMARGVAAASAVNLSGASVPRQLAPSGVDGGSGTMVGVRVYIGDTELRGMIRTEIDDDNAALAAGLGV